MYDKPIAKTRVLLEEFEKEKTKLAGQKTGEKVHDKGIDQRINGQDQGIKQINSAIATMEHEQDKLRARIAKLQASYDVLAAMDAALVRPTPPLTSRPKPGEFILQGAAAKQSYGVSKDTQVTLAKGSFKHIAVFKSSEPVTGLSDKESDKKDEKWEKWQTIDGGGTTPRTSEIFVCLTDLRIQPGDPKNPWTSATSSLIGWIDIDKLVADSGAQNSGTATPKP